MDDPDRPLPEWAERFVMPRSQLNERHTPESSGPSILFLCVHNAGRSQMAAAFARHLAGANANIFSGGSEPAELVNPAAVAAMREVGIDVSQHRPQRWSDEVVQAADVVVTMGCGDACPVYPGKRYIDWELDDPAGQPLAAVRAIRDDIERRVRSLLQELGVEPVEPVQRQANSQ